MSPRPGEFPTTQTKLFLRLRDQGAAREVAWSEFQQTYGPVIAGFARHMGARQGEIDDVVQEVMLGFYGALPEFTYDRTRGRFRGYLKTCTWRKLEHCIKKRQPTIGDAQWLEVAVESRIDAAWEQAWRQAQLGQALKIVRDRYTRRQDQVKTFDAFEHCRVLGHPPAQVASELGMSVNQVHQAVSRIDRAMRDTMSAMEAFAD